MGVRPRASAAGPYTNTRRGTGILPVMFMARMAMPRLWLRLRRAAPPAGLTLQKCHAMAQLQGGFDEEGRFANRPSDSIPTCTPRQFTLKFGKRLARGDAKGRPSAPARRPSCLPWFFVLSCAGGVTVRSHAFALGGLTGKQECFRIRSLSANFERAEILVPLALRNQRMGFNPNPKLIKVSDADVSIPHPVRSGVGGLRAGVFARFRGGASVAKNHAAQIISEASNIFRVGGRAETLGEIEELFLFALLRCDPLFHELHDDPVGAEAPLLREAADLARRIGRKAHGLANDFVRCSHGTIVHQNGDTRSSAP